MQPAERHIAVQCSAVRRTWPGVQPSPRSIGSSACPGIVRLTCRQEGSCSSGSKEGRGRARQLGREADMCACIHDSTARQER